MLAVVVGVVGLKSPVGSVAVGVRVRDGDTGGEETMLDAWDCEGLGWIWLWIGLDWWMSMEEFVQGMFSKEGIAVEGLCCGEWVA